MKRFLRAACGAVMLLLLICPVKTLADDHPAADKPLGGNTTFDVSVVEKYHYLQVQVMDGDDHNLPIAGIPVKVYTEGLVPGQAGYVNETQTSDADGMVTFKLDKSPTQKYTLEMGQNSEEFHPYRMKGITLPYKHTGVGEIASGDLDPNDPDDPNPIPDPQDNQYGQLYLKPRHFPVTYEGGEHGTIEEGQVEYVRYGKSPTAANLKMDVPDEFHVDGWLVDGDPAPKKLHEIIVKEPKELTAHYVRQYLVTYTAGDYGYLDGVTSERVVAGEKPAHVPTPTPMSEREYRFVKWRFDKMFSYDSIDPASVVINGDTAFQAVFDVRKRQPVIVPAQPSQPTQPGAIAPQTDASAPAGVPGGIGGVPGGIGGVPGGGGVGGKSAGLAGTSASETPPSGQEETNASSGETAAETRPGPESPGGPDASASGSATAASGQAGQGSQWRIPLQTLLCCLLTLAGGLLRLKAIRGITGRIEHPAPAEGEEEVIREDFAGNSLKAIVTEVILGLICVVLWVNIFISRTGPGDMAALVLWGVILLTEAVLLACAEYRLRRLAARKER